MKVSEILNFFDTYSDLELSGKSEVRFRYPNHILVMKFDEAADSECDSDEESEDEEEKSVVYYSSSNDRSTHLVKTKRLEHVCFVDVVFVNSPKV